MKTTLQQRAKMYSREVNMACLDALPAAFGNSIEMLWELVRSVVREELQKQQLGENAPGLS